MLTWDQVPGLTEIGCERAWVEIDETALMQNVQQIRQILAPGTALMAVVKADAYGHGAIAVAQRAIAAGATWLGVATVPEGIELRRAGIQAPVLIMGAINAPEEIRAAAHWQLQPTLGTPKQALVMAEALGSMPLQVHIMIDTGMSRLGTNWSDAVAFLQLVWQFPSLQVRGIYSHLATADELDVTGVWCQQRRFDETIARLEAAGLLKFNSEERPLLHLANSAGTLRDQRLHYDLVRPGLALYGLYPSPHLKPDAPDSDPLPVQLRPVMQVRARITQVKQIAAGTGVSYGHRFVADRDLPIAVVGIGYADGVPRRLSNQMSVLVRGQRVRQIGAITMDQLMLDLSPVPDVQVGEVVTLLGQNGQNAISADDWAEMLGTISWEILCGFKHRLPRIYQR